MRWHHALVERQQFWTVPNTILLNVSPLNHGIRDGSNSWIPPPGCATPTAALPSSTAPPALSCRSTLRHALASNATRCFAVGTPPAARARHRSRHRTHRALAALEPTTSSQTMTSLGVTVMSKAEVGVQSIQLPMLSPRMRALVSLVHPPLRHFRRVAVGTRVPVRSPRQSELESGTPG